MTSSKRLKGDELGRIVRLLRRELDTDELKAVLERRYDSSTWVTAERDYSVRMPTRWSCKLIDDHVLAFSRKHGRWPTWKDYGRANLLPSRSVFAYHARPDHFCRNERWSSGRKPHPDFWMRMVARVSELDSRQVMSIPNMTVRRDAITAWGGLPRLVQEGQGKKIQQDDYGILWRLAYAEPNTSDWFSLFVEVVNSTPQLDARGGIKHDRNGNPIYDHYFLRVPPGTRTAKEAVAWTGYFEKERPVNGPMILGDQEFDGFVAQS